MNNSIEDYLTRLVGPGALVGMTGSFTRFGKGNWKVVKFFSEPSVTMKNINNPTETVKFGVRSPIYREFEERSLVLE